MEISTEELVVGLMEEVKRLTLENIVLKASLQKLQVVKAPANTETDE